MSKLGTGPIEVWRGSTHAWECDHLGHFNTRFYVERVEEALAVFTAMTPLRHVAAAAGGQIAILSQYMRFVREIRVATPIHATAQVIDATPQALTVLVILYHSQSNMIAASFRLGLGLTGKDGKRVNWPESLLAAAGIPADDMPAEAAPRSIDLNLRLLPGSGKAADRLGLPRTGLGMIQPADCDANGRWRISAFMGRIGESIGHTPGGEWRKIQEQTAPGGPIRMGAALVEFQTAHFSWPQAGDLCEVRSTFAGCTDRVVYSVLWLFDPITDTPWASVKTVAVSLDLETRKLVALTQEAQAAYRAVGLDPALLQA